MKSLSNKIFKNYQVNVGMPFQVRTPVNFHTLQHSSLVDEEEEKEESNCIEKENPDEIIARAKEEAELIIKEAQMEALRLLENTEREASESKLAIEEEARRIGYEEGYHEAKRQCEDILQEAEFVREHARAEYREVLESIESDAVNVILDIAKKVIGNEISLSKENMLYLIKQAFEKCANKENVVLRVCAEDYDYIIENKEKLQSMVEGIGTLDIKKDASMKAGACLVETPYGNVDAGVQTKLKKIEEAFRSVIGK
ncbi:MAG: FliH/SctL family protein [Clostridia bacterium]|nr:FliH/SctL family protein [Clostridia bacterium]